MAFYLIPTIIFGKGAWNAIKRATNAVGDALPSSTLLEIEYAIDLGEVDSSVERLKSFTPKSPMESMHLHALWSRAWLLRNNIEKAAESRENAVGYAGKAASPVEIARILNRLESGLILERTMREQLATGDEQITTPVEELWGKGILELLQKMADTTPVGTFAAVAQFRAALPLQIRRPLLTSTLSPDRSSQGDDHREERGRTVFGAVRDVIWRRICDPEGDVYKSWIKVINKAASEEAFRKAIGRDLTERILAAHLCTARLAVYFSAITIGIGYESFCEITKPSGDAPTKPKAVKGKRKEK